MCVQQNYDLDSFLMQCNLLNTYFRWKCGIRVPQKYFLFSQNWQRAYWKRELKCYFCFLFFAVGAPLPKLRRVGLVFFHRYDCSKGNVPEVWRYPWPSIAHPSTSRALSVLSQPKKGLGKSSVTLCGHESFSPLKTFFRKDTSIVLRISTRVKFELN